jgi:hypothetical protein
MFEWNMFIFLKYITTVWSDMSKEVDSKFCYIVKVCIFTMFFFFFF